MFLSRLKHEIQKNITKARSNTVVEAFALVQLYEKEDFSSTDIGTANDQRMSFLTKLRNGRRKRHKYKSRLFTNRSRSKMFLKSGYLLSM